MRKYLVPTILVICAVLVSVQPVISNSRIQPRFVQRPDTTQFNPMHVGDRWWNSGYNSMEDWLWIGREILADTLVNDEVFYRVWGLGGGFNEEVWQINRGDSVFFLDLEDYDDDPLTSELLFFNWGLEEPGDTCWLYRTSCATSMIMHTIVHLCDIYESPGLDNDTVMVKQFFFEPCDEHDFPWGGLAYFEWWAKGYGPFHFEFEDAVEHNIACEIDGVFYGDSTVLVTDDPFDTPPMPVELACYPNPFNPETTISYSIPSDGPVRIDVYNIRGQRVRTLVNERLDKGDHSVVWHGEDDYGKAVSSGVYLYRIEAAGRATTRKMLLLQ